MRIRNTEKNAFCADMLVRYPCMREDDLCDLLKFDKKILRAKLATLKSDRFVQVKLKIETGEQLLLHLRLILLLLLLYFFRALFVEISILQQLLLLMLLVLMPLL